jgi:hypothetical protein
MFRKTYCPHLQGDKSFSLFAPWPHYEGFLDYVNIKYNRIQFTVEYKIDGHLRFLSVDK